MTNDVKEKAIDENLFTWPDPAPALLGSRCKQCGATQFPVGISCEACGSEDIAVERLPGRGQLWTWTIQRFMPKSPYNSSETPETFKPYGVGYLDLPSGMKIEGRILCDDPESLKIGQPMEVAFYCHRTDEDGTSVINYAFKPV